MAAVYQGYDEYTALWSFLIALDVSASSQRLRWANAIKMPDQHINANKNGFLLSTKCLEMVMKYSYFVSII